MRSIFFVLFVSFCETLSAADKSGVTPNTISLPKGPGSIEGLGESFQPTLNTGTAKYGVPLKLPPGTAGHAPELRLSYEGGGGNGILGFGWTLPSAYIQRRCDKGIPTYGHDVGFPRTDTFINEMKEELVPQADGYWFCENEGAFIRYRFVAQSPVLSSQSFNAGYWQATLPDGTRLQFGLTAEGRIENEGRIFCWLLQKETDTRGNTIEYSYRTFSGMQNTNQKYLAGISYGPGAPPWENFHFVRFEYEDRSDWFEDCRSGFIVRTGKRLREIIVGTQGPVLAGHQQGDFNNDGRGDYLARKYRLRYLNYADSQTHWSLLASIQPIGADGTSTLPASTFGYNVCDPPDLLLATGAAIGGINEPPFVMDNPFADLIDLNGDGLPDILKTGQSGGEHTAYINAGPTNAADGPAILWREAADMTSTDGLAWLVNLQSGSDIAHLADMDGDGLSDLVYRSADHEVYFFVNESRLNWGFKQTMSVEDFAPPSPFGDDTVRTVDIDFDKRIDLIQSVSAGFGADYRIWFNLSHQTYSQGITLPQDSGFAFQEAGVHIADFNGDRVPDVMRLQPDTLTVTAGLGYGRFSPAVVVNIPDLSLDEEQVRKAKLIDITGDGLSDLVLERPAPAELWYWVNLGNYTFSNLKLILDLPTPIGANPAIRWADLNGNGSTDLIYADSASEPRLQTIDLGELLNCGASPNVLTAISNGIGRVTLIGYQPSTRFALDDTAAGRPWTNIMPNPVSVVASVTNLDSLGHEYVARFRYHDGYYDPEEKQFRGFARVEQIDVGDPTAPTLETRSHFDTGRAFEVMKGKLLRLTTEQEDGKVFADATTAWTIPPKVLMTGTNGQTVNYAHPIASTNTISELGQGTPRRLETEMDYDNFGNQTLDADYGIVENGDFDDERIITTTYAVNTNAWLIRSPMRSEIKDEHGHVISRTDFFYDDETFSGNNWGIVTIGDLTMKREWIWPATNNAYIASARTKYDSFGNPITLLDPLADALGGAVNFNKGHARELDYDPRFHTYPITETIHLGQEVGRAVSSEPLIFQATYDEGFGTVISSSDFNANTTTYGYDTFARLTSITKPGDTPQFPTVEYAYALAVPTDYWSADDLVRSTGLINYIETRQLDKPPSAPVGDDVRSLYFISRQFIDGLGRALMTKTEAEPESAGGPPRVAVTGAVLFNARQKPFHVLNPFFSVGRGVPAEPLDSLLSFESIESAGWSGQFQDNGQLVTMTLANAHASRTIYDATLRGTSTINPDTTFTRVVYEPLVKKSFDENDTDAASPHFDTPMVHHSDGLNRLIRVDEIARLNDDGNPGPLNTWTTRYQYDLNDQLRFITDSQNNLKEFRYDGLKRKTFMDDPDRGHMTWLYDDAGNLRESIDAKSQRITYTYDGVNRILTEDYHDGLLPPYVPSSPITPSNRPDVAYFYDVPVDGLDLGDTTTAIARNTKGMLAYVWDLSGEEHTSNDARGRVEYTVKRIPDPQFVSLSATGGEGRGEVASQIHQSSNPLILVSYTTRFAYDSLDRLTCLTYPDNDEVTHHYNDRNLLDEIRGGVNGLTQNGRIISGLQYWPSAQQATINYGNGVRTTYAHDPRLRLSALITHHASRITDPLINFAYDFDSANNIKSIEDRRPGSAVSEGDPRRNTQIFQYDDLYRLTRAQYSFNLPGEAPRNDGEINYRYDRIGNMLAQTSTIDHDEKGLPVANLGTMESGGTLGRWNRTGRRATDPPGPHALTSITQPSTNNSQPRLYSYDANGNMLIIDGLTNTWDFKDRLIAVESPEMTARYTYDYTDRRISKRVIPKQLTTDNRPLTTIYVNKYFEVREHDAPTKYIWNGETRVARVTASLSPNTRIQRLRLHPGWNLISLAVTASSSQISNSHSQITAAFKWEQSTLNWSPVAGSDSLSADTVLWLHATTGAILRIAGAYPGPQRNPRAPPEGAFLGNAALEVWSPGFSRFDDTSFWLFAADSQSWLSKLPAPLAHVLSAATDNGPLIPDTAPSSTLHPPSAFLSTLSPGSAFFAQSPLPVELEPPDAALSLRYYHQDHLGSSSYISDFRGSLLEENAFYPFGHPRRQVKLHAISFDYSFTQKEQDQETALSYFLGRYYSTLTGRFASVDPVGFESPIEDAGITPLRKQDGPYTYVKGNPLNFTDPDGRFSLPNHERHTRAALEGTWSIKHPRILFSAKALNVVVEGNLITDQKRFQGQGAEFTAMHSMAGQVGTINGKVKFQSAQEARTSAESFVEERLRDAVEYAKSGNIRASLGAFGMATHSVQDAVAHSFARWEAEGTGTLDLALWATQHKLEAAAHLLIDYFPGKERVQKSNLATQAVRDRYVDLLIRHGGQELAEKVLHYDGD